MRSISSNTRVSAMSVFMTMLSLRSIVSCIFAILVSCTQNSCATSAIGTRTDFTTRTCEPIRLETCKGLGYNNTGMPNLIGHELQQDAEMQFETFMPLIQYGCSSQLKFFLCSVYFPMCTEEVPDTIGPCRPLCESVKSRCQPVLLEFGFFWPSALNCSKFPEENNQHHMCMEDPKEHDKNWRDSDSRGNSHAGVDWTQNSIKKMKIGHGNRPDSLAPSLSSRVRGGHQRQQPNSVGSLPQGSGVSSSVATVNSKSFGKCTNFKLSDEYFYINRTERCAHNCSADILFSRDNKEFADMWTLVWSVLCCISTLFTLLTFSIESSKVHYSERVIMFMSVTYLMYAMAYFVQHIVGRDSVACARDPQHGEDVLIQEGLDNFYCTIVFVLLYYFAMAGLVWWVILTITWFQSTGLSSSSKNIERHCSYFHAAAWGLPGLKVLAILVLRAVDADELTGTCYVGNQSLSHLLWFVILPTGAYLSLGLLFLVLGLFSVVTTNRVKVDNSLRVRHGSHHSCGSSTAVGSAHQTGHQHHLSHSNAFVTSCCSPKDKADLLNLRVLIFAAFFILPSSCILGANVYEYLKRDSWYASSSSDRPNVEVFIFKIFMSLIVGMKSGFWVWSSWTPWSLWSKMASRLKTPPPMPSYLVASASGNLSTSVHASQKVPFLSTTLEKSQRSLQLPPPPPPLRHNSRKSLCPGGETTV